MSDSIRRRAEKLRPAGAADARRPVQKAPRARRAPAQAERPEPRDPSLSTSLLAWYDRHRRELPWRDTRDPYAVWVSEVMLQQTQVATVLRYFPTWMRRFPSVRVLARAAESDVLHVWQGLGYYSRARRLHQGAQVVLERHAGELPREHAALLALPGIGAYSAGAIASIAFGAREPLVDGNVVRVLTRVFGLRGDPAKAPLKSLLWQRARELVPAERPGDFNQALMELGATVCTPRGAGCERCPLGERCVARRDGLVDTLPELPPRAKPTTVRVAAVVVREGTRVLLRQLGSDAPRWAGLWIFPQVELGRGETPRAGAERAARELAGVSVSVGERLTRFEHAITRFRIDFAAHEATRAAGRGRAAKLPSGVAFVELSALSAHAMPAPHRKLALLLSSAGASADEAGTGMGEASGKASAGDTTRRRSSRDGAERPGAPRKRANA